jgi:[acyl-carrier-protein] S-malonyltransferase
MDLPSPVALAFPGAGIQPCGHEAAFRDAHADCFRPLLALASDGVGADLWAAAAGDLESLPDLARQAFTFAYGVAVAQALRADGAAVAGTAGHSLGVYAACVAAGALDPADGLALLVAAREVAGAACAGRGVGMLAVAGLDEGDLAALPAVDGDALRVVLVNAPGSVVLAGPLEGLEAAQDQARAAGALRTAFLDRGVAYHHPRYMARAGGDLADVAATLAWRDPAAPVASSIDGRLLRTAADARLFVSANLATPIRWPLAVAALAGAGAAAFAECGPGLTLTRLARFLEPERPWTNVRRWVKGL